METADVNMEFFSFESRDVLPEQNESPKEALTAQTENHSLNTESVGNFTVYACFLPALSGLMFTELDNITDLQSLASFNILGLVCESFAGLLVTGEKVIIEIRSKRVFFGSSNVTFKEAKNNLRLIGFCDGYKYTILDFAKYMNWTIPYSFSHDYLML